MEKTSSGMEREETTVAAVLAQQVVVPAWLRAAVAGLAPETPIIALRRRFPFGTYLLGVELDQDGALAAAALDAFANPSPCHDPSCGGAIDGTGTCDHCGLYHGGSPCPSCGEPAWHRLDCGDATGGGDVSEGVSHG